MVNNNVPTTNTNRLGNRNGARIFLVLCLSHVVERREKAMKLKVQVVAEWWLDFEVDEDDYDYEDRINEDAIDKVIEDPESFNDAQWDVDISEVVQ